MSNTDNIHKKVLVTNALKTNFLSNTNPKTKQHQKRFSNISKEKQPIHQYRQTIHKNTTRYNEEIDMQGSATILPQKNSSRKNIYMNQNTNTMMAPSHQRKESAQQLNLNPTKAKSPIDKTRFINPINSGYQTLSGNPGQVVNGQMMIPSNLPTYNLGMEQNLSSLQANQVKPIPQIKNLVSKIGDVMTEREKSQRGYFQREEIVKDPQFKKKSMIVDRKCSNEFEELMCNEELEINLVPEKEHTRKISNTYTNNKNETKTTMNKTEIKTTLKQKQQSLIMQHNLNARTEKKCQPDKPTILLQKAKSQHTITVKQPTLTLKQPTLTSNLPSQISQTKSIPHLMHQRPQNSKFYLSQVNLEQELRKFSMIESELNMTAEIETIIGLENRQVKYVVQPNYIQLRQKNLNWFMRAILVDWMMHVCYEFGLKRETYHLAVALADKYLEKTNHLSKSEFQLAGAATMFIAAKLQQFEALSSGDFSKSTDNRYSPQQIRQMQLKICRRMNFQLNPPTLFMWANRFMAHWDSYIDLTDAKFHCYFNTHKPKYFKKEDQQSYLLFREMMQFIDCSILDVQTLQFVPKILVCSFMYLVLGKSYKEWPIKRIVEEFPRSSHYLVQEEGFSQFNQLFHMFLADSFQLDIIELLPAVQYCSTYFNLPLSFDSPSYALKNGEEQSKLLLQEYESFQTYNGKMIDLVKKRYRGVYP